MEVEGIGTLLAGLVGHLAPPADQPVVLLDSRRALRVRDLVPTPLVYGGGVGSSLAGSGS